MSFRVSCLLGGSVATLMLAFSGCMPAAPEPVVQGPISTSVASKLQGKKRIAHGNRYSVPYEFNGQEFAANWELANALKQSSQLQMRPPAEFSVGDLYQALEMVLNDYEHKPWYRQIDETVLTLMRQAHSDPKSNRATGHAPDTPYDVAVKVDQHTKEWFLEVKVQILDEDGNALGF